MAKEDLLAKGAILQRDEETYAIVVRLPASIIDIATGRRIADVARKYNAKTLKVTGGCSLKLKGGGFKPVNHRSLTNLG